MNIRLVSLQLTKEISITIFTKTKNRKLLHIVIEFCLKTIPCSHLMLSYMIALAKFTVLIIDQLFLVWFWNKKEMTTKKNKKTEQFLLLVQSIKSNLKLSKSLVKLEINLENTWNLSLHPNIWTSISRKQCKTSVRSQQVSSKL